MTIIAKVAADFLALPPEALPNAYPVDDRHGEYDHSDAWAQRDGWRDRVVIGCDKDSAGAI